ncbi:LicD family protein [Paraeggerthella hongkongensis]|uniref:LicD family protein n=1 Tax=unclassified Paraeggerthella TaxID=2641972 RepID=UPI000DF76B36|nr:LicD family protein [Paraeggerthella sp. Marseille-Q4926]MDY3980559.1 LicD family protein [Paraeggerthella sp.]RDB55207.1 LicD family protein [Paraeggerthella hongkongensis]
MDNSEALKKLQGIELEILLVLKDFCLQHDIAWFLDGGTALGAARHQGFIPWDDDIDVGMIREDYDRFVSLAKTRLPAGFSFHDGSNTPGYAAMFAKVYKDGTKYYTEETIEAGCNQGIFVDVFPYDRLENTLDLRKKQIRNARIWQSILYLYYTGKIVVPHKGLLGAAERGMCKTAHLIVSKLCNPNSIRKNFERSILFGEGDSSSLYLSLPWPNVPGFRRSDLLPATMLPFEKHEFPAPALWKKFLEATYGNWEQLPSVEDRHTHLPKYLDFGDGTSWSAE